MQQIHTIRVTIEAIMRRPEFARGFQDVRSGRRPDFDAPNDHHAWGYERGRQFAILAPTTMPLRIGRKLNPKAVALYRAASKRSLIR